MLALLLAYSTTAYFFSGSVCYLASQNNSNQDTHLTRLNSSPSKLKTLWITVLWPLWMVKEIKVDTKALKKTSKGGGYLPQKRELASTFSRGSR